MKTMHDAEMNAGNLHNEFNNIIDYIECAAGNEQICDVEKELFRKLCQLGCSLLVSFVKACGTGYQKGNPPCAEDGSLLEYKGPAEVHYLSIFGEITIERAAYASNSDGYFYPLDKRLNLPEKKYSYLLDRWLSGRAVETNYREAVGVFHEIFDFGFHHSMGQRIVKEVSSEVDAFYDQLEAPVAETEGSHLAISADGKGIPLLKSERPETQPQKQTSKARRGKGEKPGVKKESIVTTDFSFDPGSRQPEEIVKALLNEYTQKDKEQAKVEKAKLHQEGKPQPRQALNKHIRATLAGKDKAMSYLMERILKRDPKGDKKVIVLLDGDPALEKALDRAVKTYETDDRIDAVILDIYHASEYLWDVGTALFGEKGPQRVIWVKDKLLAIVQSKVGRVIGGLKQIITKNDRGPAQLRALRSAITYFENHRHMMDYATYLEKGYPIATGLVEATCGSLVKDRLDLSGMHWGIRGSQAVLDLRAVKKNNDWDRFWAFYMESEKSRLYADNYRRANSKAA